MSDERVIHINPVFHWNCGELGLSHTNDKDVNCPKCLALKPIDLTQHPLAPFFKEMIIEYERGKAKYGEWNNKDHNWQKNAVKSECLEWEATSIKTVGGEEREMQELTHLANVAGKRWSELKRG
jgi:hypothetical protein